MSDGASSPSGDRPATAPRQSAAHGHHAWINVGRVCVALIAVLVLVTVAARMAAGNTRPIVVVAIAANPLVLVHLV
ncbi:MAG TPA: hypothetical protein VIC62_23905, partial [Nakamurella sp.]